MARRSKYQQKEVFYGDEKVILYSIDGLTWSTRKDELDDIVARHELERASYGDQIKGGPQAKVPTTRPKTSSVTPRRSAAHVAAQVSKQRAEKEKKEQEKSKSKSKTKAKSKSKSKSKTKTATKTKSKAKTKSKSKTAAAKPKPRATSKAKSKSKSKAKAKKKGAA